MVSLFFMIFLALTIFSIVIGLHDRNCEFLLATLFGAITFVLLIWDLMLICKVGTGYIIDDKIKMYEEENKSIEQSIDMTVKSHMNYEASTYGELKDKDAMNLVSIIPELKSDELVQKQIEVYVNNNAEIKELKEKKIELSESKWFLYFDK